MAKLLQFNIRSYFRCIGDKSVATRLLVVFLIVTFAPENNPTLVFEYLVGFADVVVSDESSAKKSVAVSVLICFFYALFYSRLRHIVPDSSLLRYVVVLGVSPFVVSVYRLIFLIFLTLALTVLLLLGVTFGDNNNMVYSVVKMTTIIHISLLLIVGTQESLVVVYLFGAALLIVCALLNSTLWLIGLNFLIYLAEWDLANLPKFSVFRTIESVFKKAMRERLPRIGVKSWFAIRACIVIKDHALFAIINATLVGLGIVLVVVAMGESPQYFAAAFSFWMSVSSFIVAGLSERLRASHESLGVYLYSILDRREVARMDNAFLAVLSVVFVIVAGLYGALMFSNYAKEIFFVVSLSPIVFITQRCLFGFKSKYRYLLALAFSFMLSWIVFVFTR